MSFDQIRAFLGIAALVAIAFALSERRAAVSLKFILTCLAVEFVLALTLLWFKPLVYVVEAAARVITHIIGFAQEGSRFVFGDALMDQSGPWGFVFAIQVLPPIVFFSALISVLYHFGVMQWVIRQGARLLRRGLRITGPEGVVVTANIFVGQTEAPLCIRPYIPKLTRAEIMVMMTTGFATIAGSTLIAYVGMLGGGDREQMIFFTGHLLVASVMSAPAALLMARIMVPPAQQNSLTQEPEVEVAQFKTQNLFDAIVSGTVSGLKLAVNVGAMLLVFVALIALIDFPLEQIGRSIVGGDSGSGPELDFRFILGTLLRPLAWAMGIPWSEAGLFGGLLGEQVVATELVAYLSLSEMLGGDVPVLSERSGIIGAYALCGFANFASIGVQLGALTALAPEQRPNFTSLALRAMCAGALASWLTACVVAILTAP